MAISGIVCRGGIDECNGPSQRYGVAAHGPELGRGYQVPPLGEGTRPQVSGHFRENVKIALDGGFLGLLFQEFLGGRLGVGSGRLSQGAGILRKSPKPF